MARSKSLKLLREDNRLRCQRHASVEQPIGCRKAQGVPYPSGLRRAIWCGSSAKFAAVTRGDLGQLQPHRIAPWTAIRAGGTSRSCSATETAQQGHSGERASTGQFSAVNAGARGTTCQPLSCPPFTKLRFLEHAFRNDLFKKFQQISLHQPLVYFLDLRDTLL